MGVQEEILRLKQEVTGLSAGDQLQSQLERIGKEVQNLKALNDQGAISEELLTKEMGRLARESVRAKDGLDQIAKAQTTATTAAQGAVHAAQDLAAKQAIAAGAASSLAGAEQKAAVYAAQMAAAQDKAAAAAAKLTAKQDQAKSKMGASALGAQSLSYAFQDFTSSTGDLGQKLGSVSNNLDPILRWAGVASRYIPAASMALVGLIAAGRALTPFVQEWVDQFREGSLATRTFSDAVEGLKKRIDQLENKSVKLAVDAYELDDAREKLEKLQKAEAEWKAAHEAQTELQAKSGRQVAQALAELSPGGEGAIIDRLAKAEAERKEQVGGAQESPKLKDLRAKIREYSGYIKTAEANQDEETATRYQLENTKLRRQLDLAIRSVRRDARLEVSETFRGAKHGETDAQEKLIRALKGIGQAPLAVAIEQAKPDAIEAADEEEKEFERHMERAKAAGEMRRERVRKANRDKQEAEAARKQAHAAEVEAAKADRIVAKAEGKAEPEQEIATQADLDKAQDRLHAAQGRVKQAAAKVQQAVAAGDKAAIPIAREALTEAETQVRELGQEVSSLATKVEVSIDKQARGLAQGGLGLRVQRRLIRGEKPEAFTPELEEDLRRKGVAEPAPVAKAIVRQSQEQAEQRLNESEATPQSAIREIEAEMARRTRTRERKVEQVDEDEELNQLVQYIRRLAPALSGEQVETTARKAIKNFEELPAALDPLTRRDMAIEAAIREMAEATARVLNRIQGEAKAPPAPRRKAPEHHAALMPGGLLSALAASEMGALPGEPEPPAEAMPAAPEPVNRPPRAQPQTQAPPSVPPPEVKQVEPVERPPAVIEQAAPEVRPARVAAPPPVVEPGPTAVHRPEVKTEAPEVEPARVPAPTLEVEPAGLTELPPPPIAQAPPVVEPAKVQTPRPEVTPPPRVAVQGEVEHQAPVVPGARAVTPAPEVAPPPRVVVQGRVEHQAPVVPPAQAQAPAPRVAPPPPVVVRGEVEHQAPVVPPAEATAPEVAPTPAPAPPPIPPPPAAPSTPAPKPVKRPPYAQPQFQPPIPPPPAAPAAPPSNSRPIPVQSPSNPRPIPKPVVTFPPTPTVPQGPMVHLPPVGAAARAERRAKADAAKKAKLDRAHARNAAKAARVAARKQARATKLEARKAQHHLEPPRPEPIPAPRPVKPPPFAQPQHPVRPPAPVIREPIHIPSLAERQAELRREGEAIRAKGLADRAAGRTAEEIRAKGLADREAKEQAGPTAEQIRAKGLEDREAKAHAPEAALKASEKAGASFLKMGAKATGALDVIKVRLDNQAQQAERLSQKIDQIGRNLTNYQPTALRRGI